MTMMTTYECVSTNTATKERSDEGEVNTIDDDDKRSEEEEEETTTNYCDD